MTAPGAASTTSVRTFAVPGRSSLQLHVPIRWRDEVDWSRDGKRVTIRFRSGDAGAFAMELAPLPAEGAAPPSRESVREVVEASACAALRLPAGTNLQLEEIRRDDGSPGFAYSVTDPAVPDPPPAGAFRVMTQGALVVGPHLVTATILTQDGFADELADAMELLRTASATTEAADSWREPGPQPDPRGRVGERYTLTIPEEFLVRDENPLTLEHPSGARFSIVVGEPQGGWKPQVRDLRAAVERRRAENWLLRRQGPREVAGVLGGELLYVDVRDDLLVHHVVIPLPDVALTVTWSVPMAHAAQLEPLESQLLASLALVQLPRGW